MESEGGFNISNGNGFLPTLGFSMFPQRKVRRVLSLSTDLQHDSGHSLSDKALIKFGTDGLEFGVPFGIGMIRLQIIQPVSHVEHVVVGFTV